MIIHKCKSLGYFIVKGISHDWYYTFFLNAHIYKEKICNSSKLLFLAVISICGPLSLKIIRLKK